MDKLGTVQTFGTQYRVLTADDREWIVVDTLKEVEEELDKIKSLLASHPSQQPARTRSQT